jgi:muramoyltetrapeptide carboxypeptidase LdcA involved in peptidoglycan recycling
MNPLVKPKKLSIGDKIATISLSWGGAGELPHRYQYGKKQIEDVFGLEVIETKHALKSADWIAKNPQARAEDLMEAFSDSSIKGIISNIGCDDSIRTLPFIDLKVIRNNPKIFLGFSDTTVSHFACLKAGLTSFYGTSLLVGFAENAGMHEYQIEDIKQTLFSTEPRGEVKPNLNGWTSERLEWFNPDLMYQRRKLEPSGQWNFLQGNSMVQGRLIGGCMEVLEFLKGTDYWPEKEVWNGAVLFLETSEDMPSPSYFKWWLRNYAAQGIFKQIAGIIVARPYHNQYISEYNDILIKVISDEEGLSDLPIITEMDFGHTCPTFTIPYGVEAEIDCINKKFKLLESGVSK